MTPSPLTNKQATKVFIGYRAQQSLHFLPTMGGTMIAPDINTEKILAHATINTIQAAALNIPVGGAKGGIRADPKKLTKEELQNLIRRYAKEIITRGYCNPAFDVLGPGFGVSTQEVSWIIDTYKFFKGQKDVHYAACVVGKDEENHGLEGFSESTGRGIYIVTNNALQDKYFVSKNPKLSLGLQGKSFIISGFMFRGYEAAKWLVNEGKAVCTGIYDLEDGIFNEKGIDIEQAYQFYQKRNSFKNFPDCEYLSDFNQFISKECDILIPTLGTLALHSKNTELVNCKMLVEGYDGALSYGSSQILESKKIPVIPDVLATGGGMIFSYFEWLQNLSHQKWGQMTKQWEQQSNLVFARQIVEEVFKTSLTKNFTVKGASQLDLVRSASEDILTESYQRVSEQAKSLNSDLRKVTYLQALNKIARIYHLFGITI